MVMIYVEVMSRPDHRALWGWGSAATCAGWWQEGQFGLCGLGSSDRGCFWWMVVDGYYMLVGGELHGVQARVEFGGVAS